MNVEKIKNILAKNNRVTFKLYSLEYEINIVDNNIQIFSPTYPMDLGQVLGHESFHIIIL